jgi:hypothetical protein
MEQRLRAALQEIRLCRNNMPKEEFVTTVTNETVDNNVGFPLIEAAFATTYMIARQQQLNRF